MGVIVNCINPNVTNCSSQSGLVKLHGEGSISKISGNGIISSRDMTTLNENIAKGLNLKDIGLGIGCGLVITGNFSVAKIKIINEAISSVVIMNLLRICIDRDRSIESISNINLKDINGNNRFR